MTWSYKAIYGTSADKVSDTSIIVFQGADALVAGDVLIVTTATDNISTADGETSDVVSVEGLLSGSFTKIMEYTNGEGGSGAGITNSIWYKYITGTISAGTDDITVTLASAVNAKAVQAYIFHTDQAEVNVAEALGSASDVDPDTMTISGLASREYLFIRTTATERESFGLIASTNYTVLSTNTTSGDVSETNVSQGDEYRIFTGTGDTTDPTTGSPQSASTYVALVDAAISRTLTADAGTFTLTGNAATLSVARTLTTDAGAFSLTGDAVGFTKRVTLPTEQGSYSLTGSPSTLKTVRRLSAEAGSFTLVGSDAELSYTPSGKSHHQLIQALQNINNRKFNDVQRKQGVHLPLTTPKINAPTPVEQAEKPVQTTKLRRRKAVLQEIADLDEEIQELVAEDELTEPVMPVREPIAALQQVIPAGPVINQDDETAIEMILLNL